MIGALTGTLLTHRQNPSIIDVSGVGYRVFLTPGTTQLATSGEPVSVFVHTHVTDNSIDLFGFRTQAELDLFLLLLNVPGVGPKTALLVVDRGEEQVKNAVSTSDVAFFSSVPRLGNKNAQKIIIELKTKLGSLKELDLSGDDSGETAQLAEALSRMGFAKSEINAAIRKLDPKIPSLEAKLKASLKLLSK
jgi:holliday junction DNA helicase RuvA